MDGQFHVREPSNRMGIRRRDDLHARLDRAPDVLAAPYGAKGVGEPPTVVSTAAILSALRNATGRELNRVPVKPDDIVGL